ncbi:Rpp14/Pop5 family-domain-containing protein [Dioszegia hungarica]|uniref:Rpp14/Pop5 family-domain-containing protein n=1 Tax=Dioszegia hungarica TaxID=4972 RepID=A0AA38H6H3_9TREE|nr:Rpp14/Pop5 family-domain-containing protein [Dioszegia hungarica]KAI9635080.1 Rpp14/Pop5 family-domain-containing protein [Dioszegia hungarica]
MVRFKNRHLLVEFISPASFTSDVGVGGPNESLSPTFDAGFNGADDDGDDVLPVLPLVPFVVPHTDLSGQLKLGDDGSSAVFRALRANVLDCFGDEGWGRLASSFKVIYHSPHTTLTILRVARPHYRTLWASLTLLREMNGQPIIPRVVAISGTIKKLQNRAIAYHRLVTAQMLSAALAGVQDEGLSRGGRRAEEEKRLREGWDKEEEMLNALED